MDNVSFHRSTLLTPNTENFSIKYLPSYNPMFNPCEEVFSYIKSHVRRDRAQNSTEYIINRMRNTAQNIPNDIFEGYVSHLESFIENCLNLEDVERT